MSRNSILWSSTLALALAMGTLACKPTPPEGTTPPEAGTSGGDGGAAAGDGGAAGGDGGGDGGGGGGDGGSDDPYEIAKKKECPAEINQESPTPVFADSVLIRLPKNVPEFVEDNPFFARMNPSNIESVSCVEGVPGATISFGAMGYFEEDAKKDMKAYAQETLTSLGYPEGSELQDVKEGKSNAGGRALTVTVDVPGNEQKPEPAKAFLAMKAGYGRMYYMVFECHPAAWNALKATFEASADSMLLLNTGG